MAIKYNFVNNTKLIAVFRMFPRPLDALHFTGHDLYKRGARVP